ncbi:uncharacterized protein LY89DRAFT_665576 [Mollisia scopiformis]|uniref:Leucine-rich repeat-containing protein n=1 Tax=Mollisia scopiformis TaxID=149040 RepID=A0A194XLJ8_MOLSC|nr:uncharacterized protein LY89DRAFT_665576 [Mollisia scopiformis]KUJ21120.1 hypothetical protein LY89DRAFT_665576 [Mollisia scopiformis]
MDTEDGQFFIKNLAHFVRTHEKALANALQLRRQQAPKNGSSQSATTGAVGSSATPTSPTATNPPSSASSSSTSSTLAAALSLPYLTFASHNIKPAKLALTPHHLFYLLSRFEDLGIAVGPMNVRLENIHDTSTTNYVSFLSQSQRPKGRGSDHGSIHSVSSVRSVMSGMSSLWSSFGLGSGNSAARTEKQKAQIEADLKYLYSAFTKIPCLRLAPDRRARLIEGYEEFPFDSAVPLLAFKNISALEISDIDIRQFFGWDRLAEQLRSLTVKRAGVDDPADLLINIVLDDMDKRRRRSSKAQMSPTSTWVASSSSPKRSPTMPHAELVKSNSAPGSPDERVHIGDEADGRGASLVRSGSDGAKSPTKSRPRSNSPVRPPSSRTGSAHGHLRGSYKVKRSGSGSSHSSMSDGWHNLRGSSSNLLAMGILPSSKWRFLKHLSLADNGLTSVSTSSLSPLANTLHSLDLSANLFSQIPDCLASLTALRALNLSNCMIDSLHSLTRNPLPAITALNLRSNRLISIAGVERLYPLERLDLRDNKMTDPTELARLTGIPDIREIWVSGNPFTKTHSSYRITIFNLFRNTPGYTEDILIDTYGPSYSERRQLVERAAEKPMVPVVKPPPQDYGLPAVEVNKPIIDYPAQREPAVLRKERPVPTATTSEINISSSGRRRRTPKRRIVDLSTSETSPHKPAVKFSAEEATRSVSGIDSRYGIAPSPDPSPRTVPSYVPSEPRQSQSQTDMPRIDTSVVPRLPPIETMSYDAPLIKSQNVKDSQDWKVSGDLYRKKLEALRNEVGNGWLSVLSEEGWDTSRNPNQPFGGPDYSPANSIRPSPTTPRANSQQTIHSGRTLG